MKEENWVLPEIMSRVDMEKIIFDQKGKLSDLEILYRSAESI